MTSIFTECFDPRRRGEWFWCWCATCGWADWEVRVPAECESCGREDTIEARTQEEIT